MSRERDDDHGAKSEDQLALKLAQLSDEQREVFDHTINVVYGEAPAPDRYQMIVLDALLKNHPPAMQDFVLGQIKQDERQRINEQGRQDRNRDAYANEAPGRPPSPYTMQQFMPQPERGPNTAPANESARDAVEPSSQREQHATRAQASSLGKVTSEPQHATAASQPRIDLESAKVQGFGQNIGPGREQKVLGRYDEVRQPPLAPERPQTREAPAVPEPKQGPPTVGQADQREGRADQHLRERLTQEALKAMLGHYEDLAKRHGIVQNREQRSEISKQAEAQHDAQRKIEGHGPQLFIQDKEQHGRLQHQQLAQYVSLEAEWMSRHLAVKDPAEAARCKDDGRDTARLAKLIGKDIEAVRVKPASREATTRQNQDANLQQAARSGRTLTDAERVSAPPDVKNQIDTREKAGKEHGVNKPSRADEAALRALRNPTGKDQTRGNGGRGR